jgi:hypothetical protein
MNRRLFGTLGIMAALVGVVGSCKSDPLKDLVGTPAAIVKQFSQLNVKAGDSTTFTASVVDGTLTPLPEPLTFSAAGAGITVANDGTYRPPEPTSQRAKVKGTSAATAYVIIQGGGLRDSVKVIVAP